MAAMLKRLGRIALLFFSNGASGRWTESERGHQSDTPKVFQIRYTPTAAPLYGGWVSDTVEYHH